MCRYNAHGTNPGLSASRLLTGSACILVHSVHGVALAWHTLPRVHDMQVPIIVFHPVFSKYLRLARDCCPDAQSLKFTKTLVETAKWYFKNGVEDFKPVMKKLFQSYLDGIAGLSCTGDGETSTDFSMQVMC